jgi:membrane protease YdiL (CAAX protease family)
MELSERRRRAKQFFLIVGAYIVVSILTLTLGPHPGVGSSFNSRFYALIVEMAIFAHIITFASGMFRWIQSDLLKQGRPGWLAIPICLPIPLLVVFAYVVFRARGLMLEGQRKRPPNDQKVDN